MTTVLNVPNVLGQTCGQLEPFLQLAHQADSCDLQLVLDMRNVDFVYPYAALAILDLAMGREDWGLPLPIILRNLQPEVHKYLERIDLLTQNSLLLEAESKLEERWNRSPNSLNVLPITPIGNEDDSLSNTLEAVTRIFSTHLGSHTEHVESVVRELCQNIRDHSGSTGFITLQKTVAHPGANGEARSRLRVAVWDRGQGVLASLKPRYSHLGTAKAALEGIFEQQLSSRVGLGGTGIFSVARRAEKFSGSVWLRSDDAAFSCSPELNYRRATGGLCRLSGTQAAADFVFAI
ncbi:MAG: ATP-binding protein [Proteobacteria bacterium]|nr:MAG: ATP-binding protein [Pseudomonadota bacterium]